MATPEDRERESRDSEDTKFHERRTEEQDERDRLAERVSERLPESDGSDDDAGDSG
jgi:hypothetical protein